MFYNVEIFIVRVATRKGGSLRNMYLLAVIFFASLNLRPAITSVGPVLQFIKEDLHMNNVQASLITSLPVFCMGVFSIVSVKMSQKIGIEKSLFIAMVLLCMTTSLRYFTSSGFMLIASSLFAGVGIGIAGPLIAGFVKQHFPTKLNVMSIYSVSMIIGAAAASSLAMPLYSIARDSWKFSLSIWGILGLIASLLIVPLLRHVNRNKAPLSKAESHPQMMLLILYFACMSSIFYMLTAWLAPVAQQLGFSHEQAGYLLSVFTFVQIPMGILITELVTRFGKRRFWLFLLAFLQFIGLLMLIFNQFPWIATILLGIGAGGLFPLAILIPVQDSLSAHQATAISAKMQSVGFMMGASGPLIFGFLLDSFHTIMTPLVFVLIVNLTMLVLITRIKNRPIRS